MAKSSLNEGAQGDARAEQKKQASVSALRMLAATPKSRKELNAKLADKGYPADVINETLDKLESQGLLNDRAYAQNLASRYVHGKPSGKRRIAFEMKRRGVPPAIQQEVLGQMDPEAERERGREIAAGRWASWARLEPLKRRKKIFDFLIRRGFDFDLVRDLVEELENSEAPE